MAKKVSYEWDRETVDEHGDIQDHNHAEKLRRIIDDEGRLVLVRDVWNEFDGVVEREWAYVVDNNLPEHFSDAFQREGAKVPQRFHKELRDELIKRNARRKQQHTQG